jgi:hypothetical protein
MAAGQLAEGLPAFAHLFPADQRLLAINYLWVAPVEEGCKLLVLAGILLPAEPDWDRRGLIAAAILMAVGFEVTETFVYLSSPYNGVAELMARVLPRHLLFAVFTAIALCWYAARQRWWKLAAAWLAATLAHASYNVAGFIVDANFMPYPQERSDVTEQFFGIRLDSLIGGSWMELALAHLAALGLALAGAVLLLRRMVASPRPGSAPAMAPSPGAASG